MKKFLTLVATTLLFTSPVWAQNELPDTQIKSLKNGEKVGFNQTVPAGKVTLVSFWATWCGPCKKEIKNIRAKLPTWKKETDFNYVTVSMDESRFEAQAKNYAVSQGWDFPFYIDTNSDLMRSMNFRSVPYTVIIDKNGKVAYSHAGYEEGGEDDVYAKVKELSK